MVEGSNEPRCPVCNSRRSSIWATAQDVEYKTTDERFTFRKCLSCEALFIDPVPVDRLALIYPHNYYSFASTHSTFVDRVKRALDVRRFRRLLRFVPGDALSALDVGGGLGAQLSTLRKADDRVMSTTVVDLDAGAEARALAVGHRFIRGRIEDLRLEERFDVILMLNLIEHVEKPREVLLAVRDYLSLHGRILVQTPNYDSLDARLFRHRDWGGYHCPRHWVLFNREGFIALANDIGLSVKEATYTQGAPFWTVSTLAALERMGLGRISRERPAWVHPLYSPLAGAFATLDFLRRPLMKTSQMVFVLARS